MDTFSLGESIYREVELLANGSIVDTDDLLTIVVDALNKKTQSSCGSFSLVSGTVVTKSPTSEGKIYIIIPKDSITITGTYQLKITTTETASGYPGNIRTRVGVEDNFIIE